MAQTARFQNRVREARESRGWTQEEVARRSGLSRAGISAIESGRLVPSTAAALALARALETPVERLFLLGDSLSSGVLDWAIEPTGEARRAWRVEVQGRTHLYPAEPSPLGLPHHDGVFEQGAFVLREPADPHLSIVLATCDPAVALLAEEITRQGPFRVLVLLRSSGAALDLLARGLVHAAGVHLAGSSQIEGNERDVLPYLKAAPGVYRLIRVADWRSGVACARDRHVRSFKDLLRSGLRWVGREPGSGARRCLEEILGQSRRLRIDDLPKARDHQGVVEAIRCDWADAGVSLEFSTVQAGLVFHSVREEAYEICIADSFAQDPRGIALLKALESARYRRTLDDLPGYAARHTGEWRRIQAGESDTPHP